MKKEGKALKLLSGKALLGVVGLIVAVLVLWAVLSNGNIGNPSEKIEFKELSKEEIPNAIEREVIPEYRELERALGCVIDGKVYVVVTRGEKPTAGYEVTIKSLVLETTDRGLNLKVSASFVDPKQGVSVAKVSTYPYTVASTTLEKLPDSIELISEYEE